jgi:regulator of nucleoside diphosphate kinase
MSTIRARPAIVLTRSDRDRVSDLVIGRVSSLTIEFLREELQRAEIVSDQLAASLVAIGTHIRFIDHRSCRLSEGRLTFPNEGETPNPVSVLSPLGSALLGLGVGQTIDWSDEWGEARSLTVVNIVPP